MKYAEDKNFLDNGGNNINPSTEETVIYLKKLIEILQPLSTQDSAQRLKIYIDTVGTNPIISGITTVSALGGSSSLATITSIDQLGGVTGTTDSPPLGTILNFDYLNFTGGTNYAIGDIVTLLGGNNDALIIVNSNDVDQIGLVGAITSFSILSGGTGYVIGNTSQYSTTGGGGGFSVLISSVDMNTVNSSRTKFLQVDESRIAYTQLIRSGLSFH